MPLIKIDHIVSFSSEDPVHVANNIISSDTTKKWKCKTSGEKNAVVVLQLEKASIITGVDIGNEHSAYVEVLVSRSGTSDDYKVLLVMSSFMTPIESRLSQNVNKVRMFTKDQLSKPECDEKWDRVKLFCTQPFNKHVQYGLSFVNLHTADDKPVIAPAQMQIGKFTIRPNSPNNLTIGSLFSKKKEEKQEEELTGAAAIRAATSSPSLARFGSPICKPKLKNHYSPSVSSKQNIDVNSNQSPKPKPRNRNEILYSKDEEEPNEKIDSIVKKKAKEVEIKTKIKESDKTPKNNNKHSDSNKKKEMNSKKLFDSPNTSKKVEQSHKHKQNELKRKNKETEDNKKNKKIKNDRITKPFQRLLEGVTLVISGIQNPDRANLRTLALNLGAKYKPDWDNNCTHLICAFSNTPKFNQVKGKGKIVKKTWLEDCHSQRKRLPWRRYALDKNDRDKNESEDEIWETVITNNSPIEENISNSESEINENNECNEDASDTEERLARIQNIQNKKNGNGNKDNVYTADTDTEEDFDEIPSSSANELIDIFDGRKFYIDEHFKDEDYNKLKKYIIAYKGICLDNVVDDIDIIVTKMENSTSLKEINSESLCVTPNWIWACHNHQKLVSVDGYLL